MRRSTSNGYCDWKTSAICHCHELRTLAPLGFSHPADPFLAMTKVPSMKHSVKSRLPRSFTSSTSFLRIFSNVPERTHSWKRRWQVLFGGYRSGRSAHWAPVRKIQSTPLRTALGFCGGLPDFPGWALGFGMYSTIRCHCSFVRSICHVSALT